MKMLRAIFFHNPPIIPRSIPKFASPPSFLQKSSHLRVNDEYTD